MEIFYLEEVDSTQKELIKIIKEYPKEIAIYTNYQTGGIGSRGNSWIGKRGNLFLSFSIHKKKLDKIPTQSLSIYFASIFKDSLKNFGSGVKLKWPNDFYLERKVGGIITNIVKEYVVCGIGLNTKFAPNEFQKLDIEVSDKVLLESFFLNLEKFPSWDSIFGRFKKEFYKNRFITSDNIDLRDAILCEDGSIKVNNERIYSLR